MVKDSTIGLLRKTTISDIHCKDIIPLPGHKMSIEFFNGVSLEVDSYHIVSIGTGNTIKVKNEILPTIFVNMNLKTSDRGWLLGKIGNHPSERWEVRDNYIHHAICQWETRNSNLFSPILTVEDVLLLVSRACNTPVEDIKSKKRDRSITIPRQFYMSLAREYVKDPNKPLNKVPMSVVSKLINRDHTTLIHAEKIVNNILDRDSALRDTYLKLRNLIETKIKVNDNQE